MRHETCWVKWNASAAAESFLVERCRHRLVDGDSVIWLTAAVQEAEVEEAVLLAMPIRNDAGNAAKTAE